MEPPIAMGTSQKRTTCAILITAAGEWKVLTPRQLKRFYWFNQRRTKRRRISEGNNVNMMKTKNREDDYLLFTFPQMPLVSKEVFMQLMLGQKLTTFARCAGISVQDMVHVMTAHGHVVNGDFTRLKEYMLPWFEPHITDVLPHPLSPLVDTFWEMYRAWISQLPVDKYWELYRGWVLQLPAELRGSHFSTAYDSQFGDARRLIYNRARY